MSNVPPQDEYVHQDYPRDEERAWKENWYFNFIDREAGSGWKVVIINEADRMTPQAEVMWLDGLEELPTKTVVVFTTNNLHKLTDRFVRRCEVQRFDATSEALPRRPGRRGSPGLEAGDRDRPGCHPP